MFDEFKLAIAADDFAGKDARESFLCVQLIQTAYSSAQQGCRQLTLGEGFEGPSLASATSALPSRRAAQIRSAS
jgi:hypothetical protein